MGATVEAKARLAAGANNGSAGVDAFDQAQAQVKQNRDAAITQLKGTAAAVGAPGALTTQMAASLSAPAGVALNNLSQLGAVGSAASQSEQFATQNYMNEANAALPLIRAEADRDLGQKIGLLNAGRAHSAGSSGGASLSDSELRTRLMGMAIQQRLGLLDNLEKSYKVGEQHVQDVLHQRQVESSGDGQKITGRGSFFDPSNYMPSARPPGQLDAYQKALQELQGQKLTLTQQRNSAYGPGIAGEAAKLGLQAGLDPGTAYGLFGPETDAAYVAANKKLGLYKDPTVGDPITGQTLDIASAAQLAKISPDQAQQAAAKTHYVWSDPRSLANQGLLKWLETNGKPPSGTTTYQAPDGNVYDLAKPDDYVRAQQAFMALPESKQTATNIIGDVLQDAKNAVNMNLDYDTWQRDLIQTPEFKYDPIAFRLAFAQAQPLFAYAAALHTRQTQVPDTGPGVDPALQSGY